VKLTADMGHNEFLLVIVGLPTPPWGTRPT
jgi:hypothetical protein